MSFLNLSILPKWIQNHIPSLFEGMVDSSQNDLPEEKLSSDIKDRLQLESSKKPVEFSKLPIDVVKIITATFKYEEIILLFFVSKEFHQIFSHNTIWEKFLHHICYYDKQKETQQIPNSKSMFSGHDSDDGFVSVLSRQTIFKSLLDNVEIYVFNKELLSALFEPIANSANYYSVFRAVAQHYLNLPLSKKMRNSSFEQLSHQLFIEEYELTVEGIRKIWRLTYFSTRHCDLNEYLMRHEKKRRQDEEEAKRHNTILDIQAGLLGIGAIVIVNSYRFMRPLAGTISAILMLELFKTKMPKYLTTTEKKSTNGTQSERPYLPH